MNEKFHKEWNLIFGNTKVENSLPDEKLELEQEKKNILSKVAELD